MGRGRAKAKQTRIARDLKYSTMPTDFERLQAELAASGGSEHDDGDTRVVEDSVDDEWDVEDEEDED